MEKSDAKLAIIHKSIIDKNTSNENRKQMNRTNETTTQNSPKFSENTPEANSSNMT